MNTDQLISLMKDLVPQYAGSFTTSASLSDNPDVCNAACLWFLNNLKGSSIQEVIHRLEAADKNSLKRTQEAVLAGPQMPGRMLGQARSSGRAVDNADIAAIEYLIDTWTQPATYTQNINQLTNEIANRMRSTADQLMIYMTPSKDGPGHVMCVARHVGGVAIYDPNLGIITFQLSKASYWSSIISTILHWYKNHLDLTQFGYR